MCTLYSAQKKLVYHIDARELHEDHTLSILHRYAALSALLGADERALPPHRQARQRRRALAAKIAALMSKSSSCHLSTHLVGRCSDNTSLRCDVVARGRHSEAVCKWECSRSTSHCSLALEACRALPEIHRTCFETYVLLGQKLLPVVAGAQAGVFSG